MGDDKFDEIKAGKAKFTDSQFTAAFKFYAQLFKAGVLNFKIAETYYGDAQA